MLRVLITGCRGGIGLDVAKRLALKGHYVYATVHKEQSITATKEALINFKKNVRVFKLDILNEQDRLIIKNLRIDVLINNAAMGDSGPLADISTNRVAEIFETNIFATLSLTQIALNYMIQNGQGKIIFIGSIAGMIPMPFLGPYSMSKFTLEGMVHALRGELKVLGVNVIMINPGSFKTGFNEKNIKKKYEWMNPKKYNDDYIKLINNQEKLLLFSQLKSTQKIVKKIVLAVESKYPKKRYVAPLCQWFLVPFIRLFR